MTQTVFKYAGLISNEAEPPLVVVALLAAPEVNVEVLGALVVALLAAPEVNVVPV